jgi:hypothetical protein
MMLRYDMGSFQDIASREADLFVRGVKAMAGDMVRFHQKGSVTFSDDTLAAAMQLSAPTTVFGSDDWDAATENLATALDEDRAAMATFLNSVGWELKPSPMLLVKAKTNLFIGRDPAYGLYEPEAENAQKFGKGPKR